MQCEQQETKIEPEPVWWTPPVEPEPLPAPAPPRRPSRRPVAVTLRMTREAWLESLSRELRNLVLRLPATHEPVAVRGCCELVVRYHDELWFVVGGAPERPLLKAV